MLFFGVCFSYIILVHSLYIVLGNYIVYHHYFSWNFTKKIAQYLAEEGLYSGNYSDNKN